MDDLPKIPENFPFVLLLFLLTVQNLDKVTNFIDWATPKVRAVMQFAAPFMQPKHSRGGSRFIKLITEIVNIFIGILVASFCTVLVTLTIILFAINAVENGGGLSSIQLINVFAYALVLAMLTRFYSVLARNALYEVHRIWKAYSN